MAHRLQRFESFSFISAFSFRAFVSCGSKVGFPFSASRTVTEEAYTVASPRPVSSYAPLFSFNHLAADRFRIAEGKFMSSRNMKKRYDINDTEQANASPGKLLTSYKSARHGSGGTSVVPGVTGSSVLFTGVGIKS